MTLLYLALSPVLAALLSFMLTPLVLRQAEIDTNLDKVIDRWEYFDGGVLVRVGFTRRTPGVPDFWDVVATGGAVTRREYDDDGDGAVDRSDPPMPARPSDR